MEEQKNKEVKMGVVKGENDKNTPKYTYEQLNDICSKLFQENQYLRQQVQQAENTIRMFNRLNYLLKVVEVNNSQGQWHFSDDFMNDCMQEIEQAMTLPEEAEEPKNTTAGEEN